MTKYQKPDYVVIEDCTGDTLRIFKDADDAIECYYRMIEDNEELADDLFVVGIKDGERIPVDFS